VDTSQGPTETTFGRCWLLQDPETVARTVILCSQRWVRIIPLGLQGKATLAVGALAPRLVDLLSGSIVRLVEKGGVGSPQ
jgi:hypothetical protein